MKVSNHMNSYELRPGRIGRALRRPRRRLAVLLLIVAVSGILVATHSAPTMEHMDKATAVCLAVFSAGVASVLGASAEALIPGRLRFAAIQLLGSQRSQHRTPVSGPPSRAGPPTLQVFRR